MSEEGLDVPDFMSRGDILKPGNVGSNAKGVLLDIEDLAGALTDLEKVISDHESKISVILRKTMPTLNMADEASKSPSDDGSDISMRIKSQRHRIQGMTQRMLETTKRIDT